MSYNPWALKELNMTEHHSLILNLCISSGVYSNSKSELCISENINFYTFEYILNNDGIQHHFM